MIWIIGGTSEGRELLNMLKNKADIILSVATDEGKELFSDFKVIKKRLNFQQMIDFITDYDITEIVDLSHPYAVEVSKNAKKAAEIKSIKYTRYLRESTIEDESVIYLDSYEDMYNFVSEIEENVFFTTGSKNIKDIEKRKGNGRFIYRILPSIESISLCKENNIAINDIVAMLGPFSKELNKAMFLEFDVKYVIMKDSGSTGGTMDKILACKELGIKPILIKRTDDNGCSSIKEIADRINGGLRYE